jgi:hypothetical protein
VLENRSGSSVRFLWPDAAHVGPGGLSSRVVTGATPWYEMNSAVPPQAPQLIPSRASASLYLVSPGRGQHEHEPHNPILSQPPP